jgi:hypothetical protein
VHGLLRQEGSVSGGGGAVNGRLHTYASNSRLRPGLLGDALARCGVARQSRWMKEKWDVHGLLRQEGSVSGGGGAVKGRSYTYGSKSRLRPGLLGDAIVTCGGPGRSS